MAAYLDNLATTPLDPRVLDAMLPLLAQPLNPHARHHPFGITAAEAVEMARTRIAAALFASPAEVVFTPSATAANNLAILGIAAARERKGRHVITTAFEHPSVLEPCRMLRERGFDVDVVPVDAAGVVDPEAIAARARPDTILVSMMAVNNEVGTVQPVQAVRERLGTRGPLLHCDAAQAPGKVGLDLIRGVDLVTVSSHKVHGPKGAAALVVRTRRSVRPRPLIGGGGQEGGLWPGTVNVAAVAGFGVAMELAGAMLADDVARIGTLSRRLADGLVDAFPGSRRNGDPDHTVPHCVSMTFAGVAGETLVSALARAGVAASLGSACAGEAAKPSHVLLAMGRTPDEARATVRFGLGRATTDDDVAQALAAARELAARIRPVTPR
jgi:cysteine desulfurase